MTAETLEAIAAGAAELDANPAFPREAFERLAADGALALEAERAEEWATVRRIAAADGSVGRIYEGHLNAVERLAQHQPDEAAAVREQRLKLGVWGADPAPGEGEPARLQDGVITGTKVFCSGAGGLDRALVLARGAAGPPSLAYVDLSADTEVDRTWYRSGGMRASESHRVHFHGARVIAVLGEPGELSKEPWFSGDAIRTAAAWAGMADAAADGALNALKGREDDDLRMLSAGRIVTARATIDRWFEHAAAVRREALPQISVPLREAVATAGRTILDEAARATGSRPFATGSAMDRARRDFELFVLQHRLDPMVARLGRSAL